MICLDHVHLFSSDIEATLRFYQTMFGARIVYDATLVGQRTIRLDIGTLRGEAGWGMDGGGGRLAFA